jgi:sortase A
MGRLKLPRPRSPQAKRLVARALTGLAVVMVGGAVVFGAYPFYTDLRADRRQVELAPQFKSARAIETYKSRQVGEGAALTRIEIPSLNLNTIVVEGVSAKALAAGSGHYPNTPLPGEQGNVAIAGHSGMNGKPFNKLGSLRPGDLIFLETPIGRHTYEVVAPAKGQRNPWITNPFDWSVVAPTAEPSLTLTTCHPAGSAKQRMVARAKLIATKQLR